MAFKSIFKKLYTEYLSKYGYVYVAKFDVFVRVKNELIFFIGQKSVTGPRRGIKAFNIYAGIYTVYRDEIIKYRFENALKLDSYMWDAEGVMGISEDDIQKRGKLMSDSEFIYYDDNSTVESCLSSLEKVSRYILPVFENVMDLNSFIIYSLHYSPQNLWGVKKYGEDSLALIVSDNHRNLREYYLQDELHDVFQKAGYFNNKRNIELLLNSVNIDIESPRDNIFADSNLYKEALEEANRRKERNLALFSDLKCDDCKKTKIKSQNEKSVKASCDTKEQTNEKSKIVYLFSDGIAAGKKRTEKKTRKVYNRFEKFIGLDRLDLYFDAHVVGFDGENFLYSVYFDDNSGDGHTEMVQTAMDKLTQSFEQEYGYIGYIDVSEEDDKVVIFLDLGGSDNCENAIVAVLNALNNLSGIKTVLINEEE